MAAVLVLGASFVSADSNGGGGGGGQQGAMCMCVYEDCPEGLLTNCLHCCCCRIDEAGSQFSPCTCHPTTYCTAPPLNMQCFR
ncbi:MAG: hypothetical protein ACT4PL_14300 [Phycisphaerales bacterium]